MTPSNYIVQLLLATTMSTVSCEKKQDPPVRVEDLEGEWGWVRKEIDLKITTNKKYSFYVNEEALSFSDNAYDGVGNLYQKKQ